MHLGIGKQITGAEVTHLWPQAQCKCGLDARDLYNPSLPKDLSNKREPSHSSNVAHTGLPGAMVLEVLLAALKGPDSANVETVKRIEESRESSVGGIVATGP